MPRAKSKPLAPPNGAIGTVQQVLRTSAVAGASRAMPPGPTSVFDAAKRAKVPRAAPVDAAAVKIKSGVPIPERTGGPKSSPYTQILQRMSSGDCVELPPHQAAGLKSRAKAMDIKVVVRTLANGLHGVWRQ